MEIKEAIAFESGLIHLVSNLTDDVKEYEVGIVAIEVFEKFKRSE